MIDRRSVPEWVGKTLDTRPPPRVRRRVFDRDRGICHISGRQIQPGDKWECDHIVAIVNGGENKESNLAPALSEAHKEKTAEDVDEKKRIERIRKKHLGIWESDYPPIKGSKRSGWKRQFGRQGKRR